MPESGTDMLRKLVFLSDFGLADGAVSAMKGIAYGVDGNLIISDITHEITPFNIREASYRLFQVVDFWPEGTVFVSVVDPGVGSERRSVVVELSGSRFVVTPDNGTLTHLYRTGRVLSAREIDESVNRREGSAGSYTFHGRDVYAFTGARLAGGVIDYSRVGKPVDIDTLIRFEKDNVRISGNSIIGTVEIEDVRFGHLWTDIPAEEMKKMKMRPGDELQVEISSGEKIVYNAEVPFCNTFYDVSEGESLIYINSMMRVAIGIHQGSFAELYGVRTGSDCRIRISGSEVG